MKKAIAFIALMIISGIVAGLVLVSAISQIATPQYTNLLLTVKEKADFGLMIKDPLLNGKSLGLLSTIFAIVGIATLVLLLLNVNPNIGKAFKEKKSRLKAAVAALSCIPCLLLFAVIFNKFLDTSTPSADLLSFLFFIVSGGLLWLAAGETGWAGDFSSWKMGSGAQPFKSFVLGAVVGGAAYGLLYMCGWTLQKYFILVSEVLGRSGEPSYLGWKLLAKGIIYTFSLSSGILGGLMLAFAPMRMNSKQRLSRLVLPGVLSLVLLATVFGVYKDAVAKYDMGRETLAAVTGVPEKATESRTVVLFKPDNVTTLDWKMQAEGFGLMLPNNTIQLTYENLQKVEHYLDGHKDASIFTTTAMNTLSDGYFRLWDMTKGIDREFKNSERLLIERLKLLNQIKYLPITPENLSYLKAFTDENKWYVGGKSALNMAKAFMHFGMIEEAQAWVKKSKERGGDVSDITFLHNEVLRDGKVYGKLSVNGKAPLNTRVALLHYEKPKDGKYTFNYRNLVDAREIDSTGKFVFENLGRGEYVLALMTGKETIPYNIPSEKLKVKNAPGVVRLTVDAPTRKLEEIAIVTQ
jgi:hypothetical protein